MTFEDIMNYSRDNRDVFDSILKNHSAVVPFVGAGLSAFAYPTWQKFLEGVFEKLDWEEKRISLSRSLLHSDMRKLPPFLKRSEEFHPLIMI